MASSYKELKEQFVSGLSGGTVNEINLVTAVAPAAYLLWSVLQSRHIIDSSSILVDFLLNVGGLLLATTVYASAPALLLAFIVAPAGLLYVLLPASRSSFKQKVGGRPSTVPNGNAGEVSLPAFPQRPFLTAYRGTMLVVTTLCILAVDFRVFPRRFAKVETWGTSLMDMGVGAFVFSAGLVAVKPALKARVAGAGSSASGHDKHDARNSRSDNLLVRLVAAARAALPLTILGFIRLYSVKGLDYAEHVTEYGVHWNFFFTLSMLPLAMAFLQPIFDLLPRRCPAYATVGLALAAVYGFVLKTTALETWVLSAPRTGLLTSNREGLLSFVGYLSIFLTGMEAGAVVLPREPVYAISLLSSSKETLRIRRQRILLTLLASSGIYALLACLILAPLPFFTNSEPLSSPISRRLANPSYFLWVSAFNYAQVFLFCAIETTVFPSVHQARNTLQEKQEAKRAVSPILAVYNGSGLAIFLLANLATGAVNLGIDTLGFGTLGGVAVLLAYMVVMTACALGLERKGIKIKF